MLKHEHYAFSLSRTGAYCVVQAVGELDIAAAPHMRDAVHAARRHADHVVVDLRDVSFLDSFALYALTALQGDGSDCPSFHVVPGDGIQRVPDLLGARAALHWISPEQLES
jgi:ABC-type transporter Mla MlaB component